MNNPRPSIVFKMPRFSQGFANHNERYPTLIDPSMDRMLLKYFNSIQQLDETACYDVNSTVFVANSYVPPEFTVDDLWYKKYLDQGYKVVIDNLFEPPEFGHYQVIRQLGDSAFVLNCQKWFWYYESMKLQAADFSYQPDRNYTKLALMPINRHKPHRQQALVQLNSLLPHMHWSYAAQGRRLPNDQHYDADATGVLYGPVQRYFNPQWYNDTCLSLVLETAVDNQQPMITEKTFKPIAFQHAFMVLGDPGTLECLRKFGFVTYDNLWDESYDSETHWHRRLQMVLDNVEKFRALTWPTWQQQGMDPETLARIQHNHTVFFDSDVIERNMVNDIVNPVYQYLGRPPVEA